MTTVDTMLPTWLVVSPIQKSLKFRMFSDPAMRSRRSLREPGASIVAADCRPSVTKTSSEDPLVSANAERCAARTTHPLGRHFLSSAEYYSGEMVLRSGEMVLRSEVPGLG
jgi:hypothetical protein